MNLNHNSDLNWKSFTLAVCLLPVAIVMVYAAGIIMFILCAVMLVMDKISGLFKKVEVKKDVDIP